MQEIYNSYRSSNITLFNTENKVLDESSHNLSFLEELRGMGFKQLDADMAADKKLFQISRAALADRITSEDGGLFLETVLAFSRDFVADLEQPPRAARA